MTPLSPSFYARDAVTVAQELLGCTLVRLLPDGTRLAGTIVETEAYREDDPASHSYRGLTDRNRVMFGPPGRAYVYVIYGIHDCLNAVCEPDGTGAAVLIRAVEPHDGLERMWVNRFPDEQVPSWLGDDPSSHPKTVARLASGPGKLCRSLAIRRSDHDGAPLCDPRPSPGQEAAGRIVVAPPGESELARLPGSRWPLEQGKIDPGPRVGITKAVDRPWRFVIAGNPFVSAATRQAGSPSPR